MIRQMNKIVHFDELPLSKVYSFFKEYHSQLFEISEKVDGQFFSIGNIDNRFFSKTKKSIPIYDSSFYSNYEFMKHFGYVHNSLKNTHLDNVQIFGELLYTDSPNLIKYRIDKPTYIVFDMFKNGQSISVDKSILNEIQNSDIEITDKHIIKYEYKYLEHCNEFIFLYDKYKNELRKRNDGIKAIKKHLTNLQNRTKIELLNHNYTSKFGDEIEGLIFKSKDLYVKIVDKTKFTLLNTELHSETKHIKTELNKLRLHFIETYFGNGDILLNFNKVKELAYQSKEPITVESVCKLVLTDLIEEKRIDKDFDTIINKCNFDIQKYIKDLNTTNTMNRELLNINIKTIEDIIQFLLPKLNTFMYESRHREI